MTKRAFSPHFARNLSTACQSRRSISDPCRELGLNRQQFNRYLHEGVTPSLYNRARIAAAFGLEAEDFTLPPALFSAALARARPVEPPGPDSVMEGFPGDLDALRPYLGFYQTYHLSMSWPGRVVCSCAHLVEENGQVRSKTLERIDDPQLGIRQIARYVGMVAWWRGRIFVVERSVGRDSLIAQTTLMPFEVHQRSYLKGVTMGVAWRRDNVPYASRMIWRWMGPQADKRALVARCGLLEPSSRQLPEPVLRFLDPAAPEIVSV